MKRALNQAMIVGWPAFLMAGILEMLVFSLVDPGQLHWFGGAPLELEPSAIYTLAFFVFWVVIAIAGGITQLLGASASEINSRSFR
ncbi:MAG: hypothetical protein KGL43_14295 [Burkholderiales bacterium]|nr:hypothetical protein [Burkholderiales bacterium]